MLAVWDGHGGADAAEFCASHVVNRLQQRLQSREEVDLGEVLGNVFLDLNSTFEHHWRAQMPAKRNGASSLPSPGTTATVALIRDNYELVVAHVGDSPALLARGKQVRRLTRDHCPTDAEERKRVKANGGRVSADEVIYFF